MAAPMKKRREVVKKHTFHFLKAEISDSRDNISGYLKMSKGKKKKRTADPKMRETELISESAGTKTKKSAKLHTKNEKATKRDIKRRKKEWQVTKNEDEEDDLALDVGDRHTGSTQLGENSGTDDKDTDDDSETTETRKMVTQQNKKKKKSGGFQSMGLSHSVYKGILRKGYKIPTPIQRKTIPLIIDGKDMVAMARTGSGKTAAFLLPMFEKLHTHSAKSGARALIMSPTRELALQTLKFTKELGRFTGLRAAVVLGGDRMDDQFAALHENPDIIIATPGRFMHVVVEMDLKLKSVQYVVFDEADRLFEMGFQEQLHEILSRLPDFRQTLLFSATLPKLLVEFAKAGLHDPTLIRLDVDNKLSDQLKLSFFQCRADDKIAVLLHVLKNMIKEEEQTVVFAATKHHVEYLNMILKEAEIPSTYIYSSLDQTARKINVAKFQYRKVKVMIVTDLAARGIDIPLLDNVINFHFPAKPKLFVHRVGRVARAGRSGTAYSLISPDEMAYLFDLHVFLGRALKTAPAGGSSKDGDGLYGLVPQSVIDDTAETLIAYHKQNFDMESMVKVCKNAYSQYVRSRPAPAPESVKRVKEMETLGKQIGVHPVFGNVNSTDESERLKLLTSLKSYKASTTIFEVNATAKTSAFYVMKKKRGYHERVIQKRTSNREEEAQGGEPVARNSAGNQQDLNEEELQKAFGTVIGSKKRQSSQDYEGPSKRRKSAPVRDEENYLPYRPSDYQSEQGLRLGNRFDKEATGAILDLGGDDDAQIQRKKNGLKWDRKKKKFVRENTDDPKKKKIRTESGAWISASYKSNAYKDWVEKTKHDTVSFEDDEADEMGEDNNRHKQKHKNKSQKTGKFTVLGTQQKRWHSKGSDKSEPGGKKNKFKNRKSELKNPDQIMKARKLKAKKQAFQKQRHNQKVKRQSVAKQKGNR